MYLMDLIGWVRKITIDYEYLWMPVDEYEWLRLSIDNYGYLWMTIDIYGWLDIFGYLWMASWLSIDYLWMNGYLWMTIDDYGYLWMTLDDYGYLWMTMDVYGWLDDWISGWLGISLGIYRWLWISNDTYGWLLISMDTCGWLWLSMDDWMTMDDHGWLWIAVRPYLYDFQAVLQAEFVDVLVGEMVKTSVTLLDHLAHIYRWLKELSVWSVWSYIKNRFFSGFFSLPSSRQSYFANSPWSLLFPPHRLLLPRAPWRPYPAWRGGWHRGSSRSPDTRLGWSWPRRHPCTSATPASARPEPSARFETPPNDQNNVSIVAKQRAGYLPTALRKMWSKTEFCSKSKCKECTV